MGGRGKSSGVVARQVTLEDLQWKHKIWNIINDSAYRRDKLGLGNVMGLGINGSPKLYKKCACCGEYTIPVDTENEICIICGWIDDKYQNSHPNSLDGKNSISLTQAKINYQRK